VLVYIETNHLQQYCTSKGLSYSTVVEGSSLVIRSATLEAVGMSGEFVKAGYLVKSPPDFKALLAQWHRRWFLLMDSKLVYPLASRYVRLEYYQSDQEAKRLADPKGMLEY